MYTLSLFLSKNCIEALAKPVTTASQYVYYVPEGSKEKRYLLSIIPFNCMILTFYNILHETS